MPMVNADFGAVALTNVEPAGWNWPSGAAFRTSEQRWSWWGSPVNEDYGEDFRCCCPAVLPASAVAAADDRISTEDRSRVLEAVAAAGCSEPKEIEREDGGYEADDAKCSDGRYDLHFGSNFNLLSHDREG